MAFKIVEKGKSYALPFVGLTISGIDTRNFLALELSRESSSPAIFVIDINLDFELTRFNQKQTLTPLDKETWKAMIDLCGLKIKRAECSKIGDLYITLEDETEIQVQDAEFEGWHINVIKQERLKSTWVIGGVGNTCFFDLNHLVSEKD